MDEIVRRLRNKNFKGTKALKESMPVQGLREEDEEDLTTEELPAEEADMEDEEIISAEEEEDTEEELTPDNAKSPDDGEDSETENPLDNPYAVNYSIGTKVALSYANGTKSKLTGTIEGYDREGFYRIKWANGKVTRGITDISLADLVDEEISESKCVCGSTKFVNESNKLVCDECGRLLRTVYEGNSNEGYIMWVPSHRTGSRKDYDFDNFEEAIKAAVNKALNSGGYTIDVETLKGRKLIFQAVAYYFRDTATLTTTVGKYSFTPEINRFKDFIAPERIIKDILDKANATIMNTNNESNDPLTNADSSRPKGKRMIRSEAHPISTSLDDSIRNAFRGKKKITEEEDTEEYIAGPFDSLVKKLRGEFWTRTAEMLDDIAALGYEVLDSNAEYVLVSNEDEEGEEHQLQIPVGGTSRTMYLDFDKSREV